MLQKTLVSAAIFGTAGFLAAPTHADDASWGCQVLLCAASSKPSWSGVPYCVPPMKKLISAMKKPGFSWPICDEAKAGKPGREDYQDCPAGYTPSSSNDNSDRVSFSGNEQDMCTKQVNTCNRNSSDYGGVTRRWGGDRDSCTQTVSVPRPRRSDPYYFDIPNDKGVKERFWFNLRD